MLHMQITLTQKNVIIIIIIVFIHFHKIHRGSYTMGYKNCHDYNAM